MAYIYCITNKINGKQYIGKTEFTIEKRWKQHCQDYRRNRFQKRPLYDAMIKYGIQNFEIKELEHTLEGGKVLEEREIYWIQHLNTYGTSGYNATKGGDGKQLYNQKQLVDYYLEVRSIALVTQKFKCDRFTVAKALDTYNIDVESRKLHSKAKAVNQYTVTGELIHSFDSCYEAGHYIKNYISSSSDGSKIGRNIIRCANGERNTAYGFIWKFNHEEA